MIRVRQIKTPLNHDNEEFIKSSLSHILKVPIKEIKKISIVKKSLDARKKDNVYYVYEVDVSIDSEDKILRKNKSKDIFKTKDETYTINVSGKSNLIERPVIVGSGPAGLFCAYILAENHYNPLIIERGANVDERVEIVDNFWKMGKLDPNTNVQFGEGGAGTFSDGKLNTLVKDQAHRGKKVFDIFVENGAPAEIKYLNHPHIGTDILRGVIKNIRNKIISMGGQFRYHTCLTDLIIKEDTLQGIIVNNQEKINCNSLILAIGHSARDTFKMLNNYNFNLQPKPFAVGVRIEHSQELINESQYGKNLSKILPPANYKLTYTTTKNRGVYSFCMCPGGFVVNASSEEGRLAINGMSNYKRDEKNANSALVVTVNPSDFGTSPLSGLEFQRKLEEAAYQKGLGNIPIQRYQDFKLNKTTTELGTIRPNMKGSYTFSNLNSILPEFITEALKEAIPAFDKKIKGYANDDAILSAVESRTSSPIRIPRDETGQSNIKGIFPCGEGTGYAGGITTAAMDGLKTAEFIAKIYKPFN